MLTDIGKALARPIGDVQLRRFHDRQRRLRRRASAGQQIFSVIGRLHDRLVQLVECEAKAQLSILVHAAIADARIGRDDGDGLAREYDGDVVPAHVPVRRAQEMIRRLGSRLLALVPGFKLVLVPVILAGVRRDGFLGRRSFGHVIEPQLAQVQLCRHGQGAPVHQTANRDLIRLNLDHVIDLRQEQGILLRKRGRQCQRQCT